MRILVTRNFDKTEPIGYLTLHDDIDIPPHSVFALGYVVLEQGKDGVPSKIQVQEVSLIHVASSILREVPLQIEREASSHE